MKAPIAAPNRYARYIELHWMTATRWRRILTDSTYLSLVTGYDVDAWNLPHRKPRRCRKKQKFALTDGHHTNNRTHAHQWVKVEHTISGTKHLDNPFISNRLPVQTNMILTVL